MTRKRPSFSRPSKRPQPWTRVTPSVSSSQLVRPSRAVSERARIRAMAAGKSISTGPVVTPNSAARRARCATRADLRRVLVGVQPVFTQVPPRRSPSTRATVSPRRARPAAREGAACPEPMMMLSNSVMMFLPLVFCSDVRCYFTPARSRCRGRAATGHPSALW